MPNSVDLCHMLGGGFFLRDLLHSWVKLPEQLSHPLSELPEESRKPETSRFPHECTP